MAHRQRDYVVAGLQEFLHRLFDRFAGASDDRLLPAVDVGDHHVIINGLQYPLDFSQGRKNRGHASGIFYRHLRHAAAASANGCQRVLEGQRT